MTRAQIELACSVPVWCGMVALLAFGPAHAGPIIYKPTTCPVGVPDAVYYYDGKISPCTNGSPAPSKPIRIQCPCDLHVRQQDGVITLSGAGTLTVGPKTTDYSGGAWSSDAPVSFDNHAPEPARDR